MAKSKKKNTPAPTPSGPFSLPDFSNRRELEAEYNKIFTRLVDVGEEYRAKNPDDTSIDFLDVDPVRVRRRKNATLQYVNHVKQLVSDLCLEIPDAFYIEEEWAEINALFTPAYDMYEQDGFMVYAIALWLLDRIEENGNMGKLIDILTSDALPSDELDSPILYDPSFNNEIIYEVVRLIKGRNADCTGLKVKTQENGASYRIYMDDYSAAGRQHQDVPSRQRFEMLFDLAGRENLERAAERYESKLWEITRIYFTCRKPYTEEERGFTEQRKRFNDKSQRNRDVLQREISRMKSNAKPAVKRPNVLTPLARQPAPELFSSSRNLMDRNPVRKEDEIFLLLEEMDREEEDLYDRHAQMKHNNSNRCIKFIDFINSSKNDMAEMLDDQCAELLTGFDIGDPYEMSAALLWLIDTGSELPWLYFPGLCLMSAILGRLPWHKGDFYPEDDSWWGGGYGDDPFHLSEGVTRPKSLQIPDPVDWYGLHYLGKCDGISDMERTNLAQIVYQITGAVIPRNTTRYNDAAIILKRFGITGKRALAPILTAINMLGTCSHQGTLVRRIIWDSDESELEEPEEDTEDPEVYKQTIRELKSQIDSLKRAHHEAVHAAKKAQKKLEEQEETWNVERQELANLRELVYNQAQGTAEAAPAAEDISFPYSAAHRIVVFGGHDSWLKAIRPMLPNVRFVGTQPNADLIRHSDMVWIQPNCIGHGDFYKLINVVRTHHIPIFYFSCASAAKCAEELVQADMEDLKN